MGFPLVVVWWRGWPESVIADEARQTARAAGECVLLTAWCDTLTASCAPAISDTYSAPHLFGLTLNHAASSMTYSRGLGSGGFPLRRPIICLFGEAQLAACSAAYVGRVARRR